MRRFHGRKDRRKCDSKNFFEKHSACIVCTEKMAMECRRVSTKVNSETRERLGQSAQRSTTVRGQAGKGAPVASRVRPSRTSGFFACQLLWLIAGRSASRTASTSPLPSNARPICHATLAFLIFPFVSSMNLIRYKRLRSLPGVLVTFTLDTLLAFISSIKS